MGHNQQLKDLDDLGFFFTLFAGLGVEKACDHKEDRYRDPRQRHNETADLAGKRLVYIHHQK